MAQRERFQKIQLDSGNPVLGSALSAFRTAMAQAVTQRSFNTGKHNVEKKQATENLEQTGVANIRTGILQLST